MLNKEQVKNIVHDTKQDLQESGGILPVLTLGLGIDGIRKYKYVCDCLCMEQPDVFNDELTNKLIWDDIARVSTQQANDLNSILVEIGENSKYFYFGNLDGWEDYCLFLADSVYINKEV